MQINKKQAPADVSQPFVPAGLEARLVPVQPRTMVEQAAEAIVNAAARGVFLPGDRLIEAEIARDLNISRVPVREALRLLESQGIVINTPYKGMRLLDMTNERLQALLKVRRALDLMAAGDAILRATDSSHWSGLRSIMAQMRIQGTVPHHYRLCLLDLMFYAELMRLSGNPVLVGLWQSLSRQVQVMHAATWNAWTPDNMISHTEKVLEALENKDLQAMEQAYDNYANQLSGYDVEAALARQRAENNAG